MSNLKSIQTEIDTCYLYKILAENEQDENVKHIFTQMSEIEFSHAIAFAKSKNLTEDQLPKPSWRAKTFNLIGKIFGYDYVLGAVLDTEKKLANSVLATKKKHNIPTESTDTNHVKILQTLLKTQTEISGNQVTKFEKQHRSVGGNAIRAAVLGGNDGLVSNFSLVMGVAGATAGGGGVLLTGLAGMLAGALSMALGEWISVKSSQELYENQMELEMDELEHNPEGEKKELLLIYMAKGIPKEQAEKMVDDLMKDKTQAHEVLVREELGINAEELEGSAMEAALYSFVLFAIGAMIPVFPFMFLQGMQAVYISVIASAIGLFLIGASITLFTGKNVWYSGFRQVIFGLAAAAITFAIGKLIGVEIAG